MTNPTQFTPTQPTPNEAPASGAAMPRRQFLAALLAASAAPLPFSGCSPMNQEFQKLSQTDLKTTDQIMMGSDLIRTHDGGYFAIYNCMSNNDLARFDAAGRQLWAVQRLFRVHFSCAMQAQDGTFFIAGSGNTPAQQAIDTWGVPSDLPQDEMATYPFLVRLDANGKTLPFRIQTPYAGVRLMHIQHMEALDDGFLLFGSKHYEIPEIQGKPLKDHPKENLPWIAKILYDGSVSWEYTIAHDDGTYIWVDPFDEFIVSPIIEKNGNVTVIFKLSEYKADKDGFYDYVLPVNYSPRRFVVLTLDSAGKEVAKNRFVNNTALWMIPQNNQYLVLTAHNFTFFVLDKQLQKVSEFSLQNRGEFVPFWIAPGEQAGELIMFGVDEATKPNATLASMDASGKLGHYTSMGHGSIISGMAAGNKPGEVAILYAPREGFGPLSSVASSGMVFARYRQAS